MGEKATNLRSTDTHTHTETHIHIAKPHLMSNLFTLKFLLFMEYLLILQVNLDRANCMLLSILAQIKEVPHNFNVDLFRRWMIVYFLRNVHYYMVTNVLAKFILSYIHTFTHTHMPKPEIHLSVSIAD